MTVDLNGDLGEGAGTDAGLLALVTSANVCCGAHAGDAFASLDTLKLAVRAGAAVGRIRDTRIATTSAAGSCRRRRSGSTPSASLRSRR